MPFYLRILELGWVSRWWLWLLGARGERRGQTFVTVDLVQEILQYDPSFRPADVGVKLTITHYFTWNTRNLHFLQMPSIYFAAMVPFYWVAVSYKLSARFGKVDLVAILHALQAKVAFYLILSSNKTFYWLCCPFLA